MTSYRPQQKTTHTNNPMTHESQQQQQHIDKQRLHEAKAKKAKAEQIIRNHTKANDQGVLSRTAFGRNLMTTTRLDELSARLQDHMDRKGKAGGRVPASVKVLRGICEDIQKALDTEPPTKKELENNPELERHARYGAKGAKATDLLAALVLQTVIDHCMMRGTDDRKGSSWPIYAGVALRIMDKIELQWLDAKCFVANPAGHSEESSRWQRKHQTGSNKRTNIVLGQRSLIAQQNDIDLHGADGKIDKDKAALVKEIRREQNLSNVFEALLDPDSSDGVRAVVSAALLDEVVAMGLIVLLDAVKISGKLHEPRTIRPTNELIAEWYQLLPVLTGGVLMQKPMVSPPLPWSFLDKAGVRNDTGGYHREAFRKTYPLVRENAGHTDSIPSQLAVDFVNTLGRTGYKLDHSMVGCFHRAIDQRLDNLGIPKLPEVTVDTLLERRRDNNLLIKEEGYVLDEKGERIFVKSTDPAEQARWKAWKGQRKQEYDTAIDETAKSRRTSQAQAGLNELSRQETLHFGWSFCSRLRAYPQQSQLIHPQTDKIQRTLLKFEKGEKITVGTKAHTRVLEAIGVAWADNKMSFADRAVKGQEAIDRFIEVIGSDPKKDSGDIVLLQQQGADDPWKLLQLLRCYKRSVKGTELWDVGLEADASQSGLQVLSALRLDRAGLENTNVLLKKDREPNSPPVDGYRSVVIAALSHLEDLKDSLSEDSYFWIKEILTHKKSRSVAKAVVMTVPYAATEDGHRKAVRKAVKVLYGRELSKEIRGDGDTDEWRTAQTVIHDLVKLLRKATATVYQGACETLVWLKELAKKKIKQDREDCVQPKLEWTLSDGSKISYWRNAQTPRQIRTLEGSISFPVGEKDKTGDTKKMTNWLAPSVVHAMDALLLRTAFEGWEGQLTCIHDCILVLPSQMDDALDRIHEAFIKVCSENSLQSIADHMEVEMEPLSMGDADLNKVRDTEFMFN